MTFEDYNTLHKSLKKKPFFLNFLQISYIHSSHLCSHPDVPLSFPNVEPHLFWSTEMTAISCGADGRADGWMVTWLPDGCVDNQIFCNAHGAVLSACFTHVRAPLSLWMDTELPYKSTNNKSPDQHALTPEQLIIFHWPLVKFHISLVSLARHEWTLNIKIN